MDMQLEEKLLVWIEECCSHMLRVSRKLIICKAKIMYGKKVGDKGFKSSKGWFEKFLKPNDLSQKKDHGSTKRSSTADQQTCS